MSFRWIRSGIFLIAAAAISVSIVTPAVAGEESRAARRQQQEDETNRLLKQLDANLNHKRSFASCAARYSMNADLFRAVLQIKMQPDNSVVLTGGVMTNFDGNFDNGSATIASVDGLFAVVTVDQNTAWFGRDGIGLGTSYVSVVGRYSHNIDAVAGNSAKAPVIAALCIGNGRPDVLFPAQMPQPEPAQSQQTPAPREPMSMTELDMFISQVHRCWSVPADAKGAGNLIVPIHIRFQPNGSVISADVVDSAKYADDLVYRHTADSARRALITCSPFRLPPTKYDQWKDMTLRFNPNEGAQ